MSESFQPQGANAKALESFGAHPGRREPADIRLILRAHAELSCLRAEVIPVLRQIETRNELPDEQLGAALAYLEVTWLEARRRAAETDKAHATLCMGPDRADISSRADPLCDKACQYHEGVKRLREAVAARIAPLLAGMQAPGVVGPRSAPRAR